MTNTTDIPLKYRIFFKETTYSANLVYPREGLVGTVAPNEAGKVVAVLPKVTPWRPKEDTIELSEIEMLTVALLAETDQSKVKNAAPGGGVGDGLGN